MFFKFLQETRSKPKHIRDQYAMVFALMFTVLVGGVWSLSLPARFSTADQVAAAASSSNPVPFANFVNHFKNQFLGLKQELEEIKPVDPNQNKTTASTTEDALQLKITEENMQKIKNSTNMDTNANYQFGFSSTSSSTDNSLNRTILIGTSSEAEVGGR